MPYAVTLLLDDAAAAGVRRMWLALAEQAGADDAIRLGYSPHITFAVLPNTAPAAEVEEVAFRVVGRWTTLSIVLAGLGIFPGAPPVIWAAPVVTADLLTKYAELHSALAPQSVVRPGQQRLHVLARRPDQQQPVVAPQPRGRRRAPRARLDVRVDRADGATIRPGQHV